MWTTVDGGSAAAALRYTGHGAGTAGGGGAVLNIPVDNHELVYGRWEDDIIWDSEVITIIMYEKVYFCRQRVSHIPRPMVVRLDPNDPNIVVGIPDEPVVAAEVGKEGKKVSECVFVCTVTLARHLTSGWQEAYQQAMDEQTRQERWKHTAAQFHKEGPV